MHRRHVFSSLLYCLLLCTVLLLKKRWMPHLKCNTNFGSLLYKVIYFNIFVKYVWLKELCKYKNIWSWDDQSKSYGHLLSTYRNFSSPISFGRRGRNLQRKVTGKTGYRDVSISGKKVTMKWRVEIHVNQVWERQNNNHHEQKANK